MRSLEQLLVHNLRHAALDGDAVMMVLAYVGPVLEQLVHGLDPEQRPPRRPQASRVEVITD